MTRSKPRVASRPGAPAPGASAAPPAAAADLLRGHGLPLAAWVLFGIAAIAAGIYALVVTRQLGVSKPVFYLVLVAISLVPAIILIFFLRSRVRIRYRGVDVGGSAALFVLLIGGGSRFWEEDMGVMLNVELTTPTDGGVSEPRSDWMDPDLFAQIRANDRRARGTVSHDSPRLLQFERPAGFNIGDDVTLEVSSRAHRHVFDAVRVYGDEQVTLGSLAHFQRQLHLQRVGTIVVTARRLIDFSVTATIEDAQGRLLACGREPLLVEYLDADSPAGSPGLTLAHVGQCLFSGRLPAPGRGAMVRVRQGTCSAGLPAPTGQIVRLACND